MFEKFSRSWEMVKASAAVLRSDRELMLRLSVLNHAPTRSAVDTERAMLHALGGGCSVPVGALARVDDVLNDAILDGVTELRIIHGRSGGRIRGALHKRLREIGAITSFRLDERNAGVTIVNI